MPHRLLTAISAIYARLKKSDKAERVVDLGLEVYKENVELLFLKGVYQEQAGQWHDCVQTMAFLLKKDPYYSDALNYIGYLYVEQGVEVESAEKLLLEAIDIQPNNGYYLDSLGWLYYKSGKWQLAEQYLMMALSLKPQEAIIIEHMGDLYQQKGDLQKARHFYMEAQKRTVDPENKERLVKKINATHKKH